MNLRSLMYVPGHRKPMVERALGLTQAGASGVDAAILDLEDGVPPQEKATARQVVSLFVQSAHFQTPPYRFARINSIGAGMLDEDLRHVIGPGLHGIVLPKAETAEEVRTVADRVETNASRHGIEPHAIVLLPSIESALGVQNAYQIASAAPVVLGLLFGAEDYALDLGLGANRTEEARDLVFARSSIVNAATAARRPAFDGVWPVVDDMVGLADDAARARRLGFTGKSLIHPRHVNAVNEAFSPSSEELDQARRIVAAFEAAERDGLGAVALDGKMIDRPVVDRAIRTLERGSGDPATRAGRDE